MGYIEYTTGIQPSVFDKDDAFSKVQGTRDGAIFTDDWFMARVKEGKVYCANVGTITAPATFGAGTMDGTEFDLHVSVPSGTTIIPIELTIKMEAFGTAAIFECMAKSGTGSTIGSGGTTITPTNLRSDITATSGCTVGSAASATSGVAITGPEFFRDGHSLAITIATVGQIRVPETFRWRAKEAGYAPVIVGAGQLGVFAAANAGTGFITLVWVEMPSTRIT